MKWERDEEEEDERLSGFDTASCSSSSSYSTSPSVTPPCSPPKGGGCYERSTSGKSVSNSSRLHEAEELGVGVRVNGVKVGAFVIASSTPVSGKCSINKLAYIALSALLKRNGVLLLLAPLIYISMMLIYMGTVPYSFDGAPLGAPIISVVEPGGLGYRSPMLFQKLWPAMVKDNISSFQLTAAWQYQSKGEEWVTCKNQEKKGGLPPSNGYLIIEANGGLNQQRTSICNAVAVAGLLNATLVIPKFYFNNIWRDPSKFGDIYDEDYFIKRLKNHVRVVRKVPENVMAKFNYKSSNIHNFRVQAWSPVSYYLQEILPKLLETRVVKISPFANRLSLEVPSNIQQLRCQTNYEALKFSKPIHSFSRKLVDRMVKASRMTHGKYVSVHLRYEEDMVAFSCCIYDGGEKEKLEMDAARERGWGDKFYRKGRIIRPGVYRRDGKCPMTPLEVGMMLRGMGFSNNTPIYLASGKIYKADKNMAPLLQMFPLLQTKETLASPEELAPFKSYSSRMAALDYTVCLQSEVFVTTQGGNFPHFLMGHRRYLYKGHAKTIKPDKRKLALLFNNPSIGWETFKKKMRMMRLQSDARGIELRKVNGSIYNLPTPDCMCLTNSEQNRISTSKR